MTDTVNKALQKRKNDRTRARIVSQARKVQDKISIDDVGFRQMTKGTAKDEINLDKDYQRKKPDKFIDSIIRHNKGIKKLSNSELRKLEGSSGSKVVQELRQTKPKGVHHTTYRTPGKQRMLSYGKAGGMSYILKEMKRRLMKGTPGTSSKTY